MILKVLLFLASITSAFSPLLSASNSTYESEGDGFHLLDKSYSSTESFCFTSKISFVSGQAAGVVFGAQEDDHYWLFNVDRVDNKSKLIYFSKSEGELHANVYKEENFIGSSTTTESEFNLIKPRLASNADFYFKVILTKEDSHVFADFYIDNIKRFGVDSKIDLTSFNTYEGGYIGFNTFNSKINVSEVNYGKSDFAYYSELYRQQYHYSQFAHWNNDPNGLVYFNGYYHLYYQTNPFSKYWGDMYWGHARSKDLLHWEELPYALFPDDGTLGYGEGNGYAWSGSALVYHKGMSSLIDSMNWYPNGNGDGLFAIYTRDGSKQDQVIISSDDNGFSWTRRKLISQDILSPGEKTSCRDPKIFSLLVDSEGNTTRYGMCVANMENNIVYFLTSIDLLNWSSAGSFKANQPECVDVFKLSNDGETKDILTISGREYFVGTLSYDEVNNRIIFTDEDGKDLSSYELAVGKKMDYGYDRYATQSFYIDDSSSIYNGQVLAMSWFSGVPNDVKSVDSGIFANVRSSWNGGGQTIPVSYGLTKVNNKYVLTETPIVKDNDSLNKDVLINKENVTINPTENILSGINSHTLEIELSFLEEEEFELRVNVGEDEYTSIGYSKENGYYVDRRCTSDAGLSINYYHVYYSTGKIEEDNSNVYVLVDNGSLEVFASDFKYSFYVLTLASPTSLNASLKVNQEASLTTLKVNNISSVWKNSQTDESVIYLSEDELNLDMKLTTSKKIIAHDSLNKDLNWSITSGEDVISLEKTTYGAKITSLKIGVAEISVSNGNDNKIVHVNVEGGTPSTDLEFSSSSIKSGQWYETSEGIKGEQSSGDGFILSSCNDADFTLTSSVTLSSGVAFGIVFRAKEDMSEYLIANYDNNSKISKLWSNKREIANVYVGDIDLSNIIFTVSATGNNVNVKINNKEVINVTLTDEDPKEGYIGLNVCAAKVIFKSLALTKSYYEYSSGKLIVSSPLEQYISEILNKSDKNSKVAKEYFAVTGRDISIDEEYFKTLKDNTIYEFIAIGEKENFTFKVKIGTLDRSVVFTDLEAIEGNNVNIYIGSYQINSISVNDVSLTSEQYIVKDGVLTLPGTLFKVGSNSVTINDSNTFNVEVSKVKNIEVNPDVDPEPTPNSFNYLWVLIPCLSAVTLLAIALIIFIIIKKRKAQARKDA